MKIYIASHSQELARALAEKLVAAGHTITSSWLAVPFNPTVTHTGQERQLIAAQDTQDVLDADVLVLMAGPDKYPGGKFVEAGIAMGAGRKVFVLGRRENMLLWHPAITAAETVEELIAALEPQNCHD